VKHLNRGKQVLHEKPIVMEAMRDGVEIDIALQYNDSYSETVLALPTTLIPSMAEHIFPAFAPR